MSCGKPPDHFLIFFAFFSFLPLMRAASEPNFIFAIDGHSLTIIEADGISTSPLVVDSIQIFPGQRYSFVLEANQPVDNYCACIAFTFARGSQKRLIAAFC
jgi:FtsP/CotA-like multicopper oxidase with cupredoxin domain